MKRYLLFAGRVFYARGGWHDFRGDFDSIEDARLRAEALIVDETFAYDERPEWYHVVDAQTGTIVARSEEQAFGVWA